MLKFCNWALLRWGDSPELSDVSSSWYFMEDSSANRYSSNWSLINSSEPMKPSVLGRDGCSSSQVSLTIWVRRSIQRRSATERTKAVRRVGDEMLMLSSSSYVVTTPLIRLGCTYFCSLRYSRWLRCRCSDPSVAVATSLSIPQRTTLCHRRLADQVAGEGYRVRTCFPNGCQYSAFDAGSKRNTYLAKDLQWKTHISQYYVG
jgi:hypothetical protein